MAETDQTKGRRGFLKKLAGAVAAPLLPAGQVPVLKPRSVGASTLARDHFIDALRYVTVLNPVTGRFEMYSYRMIGGNKIEVCRSKEREGPD